MDGVILFDLGGTLDADGVPWKERFRRLYAAEGLIAPPAEFDRAFYAADDSLVGHVPPTLSFQETASRLARGVTDALRPGDRGLADRVAVRFLADALACVSRNIPMLLRLRSRYRLAVVSNFYGNLTTVCDNVGIGSLFDVLIDSTQVGARKPDVRIFRRAIDDLKVVPAAATFVGDSLTRDMAGARAIGMAHILVADGTAQPPATCCPHDRVIHRLTDLEPLLP